MTPFLGHPEESRVSRGDHFVTFNLAIRMRKNVAFGKPCDMSSMYFSNNPASFAVNNNTDGDFINRQNCVHSAGNELNPWWMVDLGRRYYVHNITVWARAGNVDRMSRCKILVDGQLCYDFGTVNNNVNREMKVVCGRPLVGQVVSVVKNSTEYGDQSETINMCEFQVFACSAKYWGVNCDTCGHCSKGEDCGKVTGNCSGCAAGWLPPLCVRECPRGSYGQNCSQTCSQHCSNSSCDTVLGHCTCHPGWREFCEQAEPTTTTTMRSGQPVSDCDCGSGMDVMPIVGAVLAVGVTIIIVNVVLGVCWLSRSTDTTSSEAVTKETPATQSFSPLDVAETNPYDEVAGTNRRAHYDNLAFDANKAKDIYTDLNT